MQISRPLLAVATSALCLGLALFTPFAVPAQATTQDEVLKAEVLPGWSMQGKARMAALKLDLAPGWKTYWRSPGEGGIPPQFDWSGSDNLRAVDLHWPAPEVFDTNGMTTIGYHDQLILPIELHPKDPSKPIKLRAQIDLGICLDICLPASLSLSADLPASQSSGAENQDPQIKTALRAGPLSAKQAGLKSISCEVSPIKDGLRVTATLQIPQPRSHETVAIETAKPEIWVSEVETSRRNGLLIAETDLVPPEGKPFALDRSSLRVTVLSSGRAVEIQGCPGG